MESQSRIPVQEKSPRPRARESWHSWQAIATHYIEKYNQLEEQLRCEKDQNIEELKKSVERLEQTEKEKNQLKESNRKLENKIEELRIKLEFSEDKNRINDELKKLNHFYKQLDKERIKNEVLQSLLHNGNMCLYSCVLSSIHWVCRRILNAFLCDRQLEKLICMFAAI
jgi:DNA repair exonuclease SbcCD ATPase subunit